MSTSNNCKDSASSDGVLCEVVNKLYSMSLIDAECANCGREGNDINNICNKCKMVKYCNAACKKKHRHKHKQECEEHLAAERAAKLHDIELFKQPPPEYGDYPICMIRIPFLQTGWRYHTCCGKVICSGCYYAPVYDDQGNKVDDKCPFCRAPSAKSEKEAIERYKTRMEAGDPLAIYMVGNNYQDGACGFPQDITKALELFHRAGELGHALSYNNIGYIYEHSNEYQCGEVDIEKANHYYELAAMRGNVLARYNRGFNESRAGNMERALKHHMIAVRGGMSDSLKSIKLLYKNGNATKEDYAKALQCYQVYSGEIKSKQRDEAAAFDEDYRYY